MEHAFKETSSCSFCVVEQQGGVWGDGSGWEGELLPYSQESPGPVGTRSRAVLKDD